MSGLTTLNEFRNVANMIQSRKLSENTKNRYKYIFLEGMIKFLKMYAINELGTQVDLDLYRIALYVNSVKFENQEVYYIKSIEDVYEILTNEVINGYPIWRFLTLSGSQLNYLESEYNHKLSKLKKYIEDLHDCRTCYFYECHNTPYGTLERCYGKKHDFGSRTGYFDSSEVKDCKLYTRTKPDSSENRFISGSVKDIKLSDVDFYRLTEDDIKELESDKLKWSSLDGWDKAFTSMGRVMQGKRPIDDIENDSLNALKFSTLYQFIDIHSKIEYGEAFEPNVAKIAKDIYDRKFHSYKTEKDFIESIETKIISNPNWANKYIKKSSR